MKWQNLGIGLTVVSAAIFFVIFPILLATQGQFTADIYVRILQIILSAPVAVALVVIVFLIRFATGIEDLLHNLPMKTRTPDDTKWDRKDFPTPPANLDARHLAELETNQDLQKPIQQLICDVHEETHQKRGETPLENLLQNLMHANKRTVSFMGKVALENKRAGERIESFTQVLVILTVVLVILTIVLALR